jgi:hypothetical protein
VHPIERLRYVARASGDGSSLLLREAAGALASFAGDPAALVTACRRLVDRQPHAAAMWWLAARVLVAVDPDSEAWEVADLVEADATPAVISTTVPDDARVVVLGWPERTVSGLHRRGDVRLLVVDALGDGGSLVRRLERNGVDAELVEERGVAAAVRSADLVLVEALGLGPTGATAVAGSDAACAVAGHAGVQALVVAGVGCALPGPMWSAYLDLLGLGPAEERVFDADIEVVGADLFAGAITESGVCSIDDAIAHGGCPVAPELLARR